MGAKRRRTGAGEGARVGQAKAREQAKAKAKACEGAGRREGEVLGIHICTNYAYLIFVLSIWMHP